MEQEGEVSERIIEIPITDADGDMYYPDERHDPMPLLEEIVRCVDCKNFEQDYTDGASFDETVCWAWDNGHDYPHFTSPDGFCYRGERREEDR